MKSSDTPSERTKAPFFKPGWWRRWARWLFASCLTEFSVALLAMVVVYFMTRPPDDRMFRRKLESEWKAEVKYYDDEQVKEWREYGDGGVAVLVRGLERANRPFGRLHRRLYRPTARLLYKMHNSEKWLVMLPQPKKDETSETRMRIVSLLNHLDETAYSAAPAMIDVLSDESRFVRQIAIGFFCGDENENTPINHLSDNQKREVLFALIEASSQSQDEYPQQCRSRPSLLPRRKTGGGTSAP